jgi:hypothetical protein
MNLVCKKCGLDYLCTDCAWDAYEGGGMPPFVNISSGEDAQCLREAGSCSPKDGESSELLQLPYEKEKKSRGGTTVIVKPTPFSDILHE